MNFMKLGMMSVLALALMMGTSSATDLSKAETIAKSGNWKVVRSVDTMTDKVSCTGLYKNTFDVQVSPNQLFISMYGKGGVDGYSFRLDDETAVTQLPTQFEKDLSIVRIGGENAEDKQVFAKILKASRLRVSVLTVLGTGKDYDLDLNGLADAYTNIMGEKCGGEMTAAPPAPAETPTVASEIPPAIAGIIKKTESLNDKCRDGSGDSPATMKACNERDKYVSLLETKGWCWGHDAQIESDKTWQPCQ